MRAMHVDTGSARVALEQGRASYAARAWPDAYRSLSRADETAPLEPTDLELLATSAYMLGRDDEYVRALERAHYAHLDAGEVPRAARCTWWIGLSLLLQGEAAPAGGWFARGERLLEREERDCVERGYLRLARMLQSFDEGDFEAARSAAAEALEIGERFGDRDLIALGVMDQGHALLELGRTREGLRLVDESMVAVTSGELSPIVAGILYCNTIAVCRNSFELRRAREWTDALTLWCERHPNMVEHKGVCLVHRAEIMRLQGDWEAALGEARRVGGHGLLNRRASSSAVYVEGDLLRLRGDFDAAEDAFRLAARRGTEPQPGLALMRLAQGNLEAALAAIRRVVGETGPPLRRAALLPAYVEIALAAGEIEDAERASVELSAISDTHGSDALSALAALTRGAVALARGESSEALTRAARRAGEVAGAGGALRGGEGPRSRRARLRRARRRGRRRARARNRPQRLRGARREVRSRPCRLLARRPEGHPRAELEGAPGPAPRRVR